MSSMIGKQIRDEREALGITRRDLAKRAGISASTLARIERGESMPRLDTLDKLIYQLKMTTGRRNNSSFSLRDNGDIDRKKFKSLVRNWREETAHISSTTRIAMHPAYQKIIGMGPAAIPLLLRELENDPDHWFWALRAITDDDPVKAQDRGNLEKMTGAWLTWAKMKGYEW